jgi:uncharacterized membrane protein
MIDWLLAISLFLHLVATAVWIGGLLLMVILVWPEARALISRPEHGGVILDLLDRVGKRFSPLTNLSLLVLIATGLFQMAQDPNYDGVLQFTNDWTRVILLKHVAVLGMVVVGWVMQGGIMPALERAALLIRSGLSTGESAAALERLRRRQRQLTVLNCVLGIIVLIFTAIATSI